MKKKPGKAKRPRPTAEQLFERLRGRTQANADTMDREIEDECVQETTVMMCDSSGFTRRTHEYGILHFLAVMTEVYDLVEPIVEKHGGDVISRGADNLLATFDDPVKGVDAAIKMQRLLEKFNEGKKDRDQFQLCMGFHSGKILRVADGIFGDKVNIAAKIGEDLAAADEILVTGDVAKRLPKRIKRAYSRSVDLGGKTFELHRVKY
ncbi:MAG: adenylate/guanylate cyclase domain-containing protein [Elusimicrobia bacterium]|nr:adenylate/guanylate cyclase domain-containing protein [Elusimicrobiota bacterium]